MRIINSILGALLLTLYGYFAYLLYDIGLLSGKIEIIFAIVILMFVILIVLCLVFKKKNRLIYIPFVIFSIIFIIGIYYLNPTKEFIDSFGKNNKEGYDDYYVAVLKDSKYIKLNDIKDKDVGICEDLDNRVNNKINVRYNSKKYEDCEELKNDLYGSKIDAVILSDVKEYLISNNDNDFENRVRIIYKITIPKVDTNDEPKELDINITKTPFTLFISGIDTNGAISRVSRSDVNIVVTVNPISHEVLLTTIPRDYYVQLNGTSGYKDKLTHAGIYGIDKSVKTVEDLLNIKINYYARVNFDTVVNLVNQIGGISIYSDQNLKFCNIKKGYNDLNGDCALRFARERHSYQTGDRHRGENQEEVIRAIIDKVGSSSAILTKYNSIISNLQNNFETDVSSKTMKEYIKMQTKDMPKWSVKNLNLNGYDSHDFTYSYPTTKLYVMQPDINTVNKAGEVINQILNNKTFSELGI